MMSRLIRILLVVSLLAAPAIVSLPAQAQEHTGCFECRWIWVGDDLQGVCEYPTPNTWGWTDCHRNFFGFCITSGDWCYYIEVGG